MTFNIYNSLILAGIIQGLIFAIVVLLSKKYNNQTIYFLVALILCFTLSNLMLILPDIGVITYEEMYHYVYLPLAALFPPLLYFYVIKFLYPEHKISNKDKLLMIPFLLFLLFNIIYRIGVYTDYQNEQFYLFFSLMLVVIEFTSVIFTLIILGYLLKIAFFYAEQSKTFNIHEVRNKINWLKITLVFLTFLTILWLYLSIVNIFRFVSFYSLWIGMSIVIYWLGHIGIYKYGINEERKKIRAFVIENRSTDIASKSKSGHIIELENLLVNKKLFLDSNLTLEQISNKLEISTSHLSRTVNAELGISFSDYINSLRVNEAKKYLKNSEFSDYTIVAIGLEAGFNSKSAFYSVFKKIAGVTPSEYKRQNSVTF